MAAISDVREIIAGDGEVGDDIVRNVRRWVDEKVIPTADELEHAGTFPTDLHRDMVEMGLFSITFSQDYGGLGLSYETYSAVIEEICRGWMGLGGIINGNSINGYALESWGTHEQKQRLLPGLASGEVQAAFSITEPNAGTDAQAIRTTAVKDGDDYVINGNKLFVTNGDRAGVFPDDGQNRLRRQAAPQGHQRPARGGRHARLQHRPPDRQDGLQGPRHHRALL